MLLSWLHTLLLRDPAAAATVLQSVEARKTRSPLLCYTRGYQIMLAGDLEGAKAMFQEARRLFPPDLEFIVKSCTYFEGAAYYMENNWEKAIPLIEDYMAGTSNLYRCHGLYKLAICKWMTGRRAEVPAIFEKALACAKEHYEHDDFTVLMVTKFKQNGNAFTEFMIYMEMINNFLEAHLYTRALACCEQFKTYVRGTPGPEPTWVLEYWLHYFQGCALAGLKTRDDEARAELAAAAAGDARLSSLFFDYQLVPYALVEQAELEMRVGRHADATRLLAAARSKQGYLFSKYIDYRIKGGTYFIGAARGGAVVAAATAAPAGAPPAHSHWASVSRRLKLV
eukprot:TRINITY_DN1856_c0_g1_i2.p2 TRINITY_DN1856_c0_g1~~TRINITY_DN1856_c0_g1_i2.p2  ORF type:complete len:339 (-),score=117.20 TRINITY_DN1856_c0_g1_i2:89-1105(-)